MYVHVRDQNDNATYASTRWAPTFRHFLACEDVAGGSQQSGGNIFFMKYGGPSGGSLLSGGGIIILRVIRRHFLAAAWTQLSASPRTVLFRWKSVVDHIDHAALRAPRRWTVARPRKGGAGEDAAVEACVERSTRVHSFGCGVRLPSPQGLASGGNSRGW